MTVRIYKPVKNAMQSGKANTKKWVLEFIPQDDTKYLDPMMGWTGNTDTKRQIKLKFASAEEAIAYATKKNLDYQLVEPKKASLKLQSYSDNFC